MQHRNGYHRSRTAAEKDLRSLHPFSPVFLPTTPEIGRIIQDIRSKEAKIACVTRLPRNVKGDVNMGITACLGDCGVSLSSDWEGIDIGPNEQFTTKTPFLNGIIHAGSENLGDLLIFFLGSCNINYEKFIIIDDNKENLDNYGLAIDALADIAGTAIPCTCLLFRSLYETPEGFKLSREITNLLPQRKGPRAEKAVRKQAHK